MVYIIIMVLDDIDGDRYIINLTCDKVGDYESLEQYENHISFFLFSPEDIFKKKKIIV